MRRRLEGHSSRLKQPMIPSRVAGVYPIFDCLCCRGAVSPFSSSLKEDRSVGDVVETRRLELLTLSLQRRCSSD